jgi:UDP-N-acetylglucosamine--N-acetylmuramyl-(pentapeptide) pyrophosphoryl-undecaprenol N-acetylglucosamine transferase
MTNYLLAGGGTGGHVNPLLALAEQIRREEPDAGVWALGTKEGLEARLVPERGFELLTIARLPFPRRLNFGALTFGGRFLHAVNQVVTMIHEHQIDVVVGFGGYAAAPAYLAARRTKKPFVVHEANALPGLANRIGARFAAAVAVCFANTRLSRAQVVGMPIRAEFTDAAKATSKAAALKHFGLGNAPTLLVTGGSLGAQRINQTIFDAQSTLEAEGIQVLHITGDRSELPEVHTKQLVRVKYCSEMHLAVVAADLAVARAGASTVAEFSALGLPAIYVPYPVGNGEQSFNLQQVEAAGGAVAVLDADFEPSVVTERLIPLLLDRQALNAMSKAAKSVGISDGATRLYGLIRGVLN